MSSLCGSCLRTSQAGCAGSENPSGLVGEVLIDRVSENHRRQSRSLDRAMEDAGLMTEREDLELQRGPAPEGSEKRRPKSGQQVPKWETKGEPSLSIKL